MTFPNLLFWRIPICALAILHYVAVAAPVWEREGALVFTDEGKRVNEGIHGTDEAVRRWAIDGDEARADLALIMFSLNDQGAEG